MADTTTSTLPGGRFSPSRVLLLTVSALWLAVLAACTPKRIVATGPPPVAPARTVPQDTGGVTEPPSPGTAPEPVPETIPEPMPETTVDNVTLGLQAAELARRQLGKSYQWGAAGPDRFDCSGLVFYVYGCLGVSLPRVVSDQATAGQEVSRKRLQPGDLLFFAIDSGRINHVGIYIGGHRFVHAPRRHHPVRTADLNDAYWRNRLKTARRINPAP